MRDTQRGSQSYMEKIRGKQEIEVTRRRRGGVKRGESNLASNQFQVLYSVWITQRGSWSYTEKRRGRREEGSGWGTRVCLWWIHFDIWQNQYNIVKFKTNKKKKETVFLR